ncbi:IPT/TIG domain-containing protein [Mongoliibacter ruber]|uniref:Kelch motif protein n=1 Tax=Mongoliibacter ruber TaxID=1750599 RepID=A0A2T0WT31_9BACT|nr:IPT/TIG domain-containing protein [Mongoliibacter ruber]PRY89827.1 Kelch motif protein [Mongoliibacter ruber]
MRLKLLFAGMLCLLFVSCENEIDEVQKEPKVQTLNADVIVEGGVILHAELSNPAKISDHGFLISEDGITWNLTLFKLRLGKPAQAGAYRYELDNLIYPGKKYFYKAFIDTDQGLKYGAIKSFASQGSKDPIILKVDPEMAHLEDWISIHGKNLGVDPSFTNVLFGDIATFYWNVVSDTLIEALIPAKSWNTINYEDLYEYNTNTNTWKKLSNLPQGLNSRSKASAVVLGEYAYIFGGALDTGMTGLYRYEAAKDSWVILAQVPDAISSQTGFTLNNKIYCATGSPVGGGASPDVWIYDPLSNTWEMGATVGKIGRYRAFSFVINGQAYVGGGEGQGQGWNASFIKEFFKLKK